MKITRINGGAPLIAPTENYWENRGTSNSGALFLERSNFTDKIITGLIGVDALNDPRLIDGVVVSVYTGDGDKSINEKQRVGSKRGIAIFSPDLELITRFKDPVIIPSNNPNDIDSRAIEDMRLTRIGDKIFGWYCGHNGKDGAACVAYTEDLLTWKKVAPLQGNINKTYNKDHVIFEQKVLDRWWMLHRPWGPKYPDPYDMSIRLAVSCDPLGAWDDAGEIMRSYHHPGRESMWVGAGAAPIHLDNNRFLIIYHTGCYFKNGYRQYDAGAAILDFDLYSPEHPEAIVTNRLEPLMVPETLWEKNQDLGIDIVFPMAAFRCNKDLIIIYGAGDKFTCAGKVPFDELLVAVEKAGLGNPYIFSC